MVLFQAELLFSIILLLGAIFCGILASNASISTRKGRLAFCSRLLLGLAIWGIDASILLTRWTLPTLHVQGVILKTREYHSGKSDRTQVIVEVDPTMQVSLISDQSSAGFRAGERIDAQYESWTGDLISAKFATAEGVPDGEFHRQRWLIESVLFVVAGVVIWSACRSYRRDPVAAVEETRYKNADLDTSVDRQSLLRLGDDE